MKLITGSKKITLSLLWIFVTVLLVTLCIFSPIKDMLLFSSNPAILIMVVLTVIVVSFALLILILSKLKREGRVSSTAFTQTSKFLGIKIVMWIFGIVSSVAIIITIADVITLATVNHSGEFAGIELVFLIPAILVPLLVELPFLVFLLVKRDRQAISLLIIQRFLLVLLGGAILLSKPLEVWYNNKVWEKIQKM